MYLKKIGGAILTAILSFEMFTCCLGASLNANEQNIINALSNNSISANYTTQVSNYFLRDDVDVDASTANQIISNINDAVATANNATEVSSLSSTQKQRLLDDLTNSCNLLGLNVTVNASTDTIIITDKQGNTVAVADYTSGSLTNYTINNYNTTNNYNNTSNSTTNTTNTTNNQGSSSKDAGYSAGANSNQAGVVKQTGNNLYITYGIIIGLIAILSVCGYVTFKKDSSERQ